MEHGLGRCGSSKTGPRPGRSALPPARLPDREGCLWLPAEEAREPGARGLPGAPPRSGWGLGWWAWRLGRQGVLFLGPGWVLFRVGTSGVCEEAGGEEGEAREQRGIGLRLVRVRVTEWFCELLSFPFLGRKTCENLAVCGGGAAGKVL